MDLVDDWIAKNVQMIKDIFTFYAGLSDFPQISSRSFKLLAERSKLLDKKYIHSYTLDMMFS